MMCDIPARLDQISSQLEDLSKDIAAVAVSPEWRKRASEMLAASMLLKKWSEEAQR